MRKSEKKSYEEKAKTIGTTRAILQTIMKSWNNANTKQSKHR